MTAKNNLTAYLNDLGVLQSGTREEIAEAKRRYKKRYQKAYMKRYREERVEVRFLVERKTGQKLTSAAKTEHLDVGQYAKEHFGRLMQAIWQ